MDKYEYKLRSEEIKSLIKERDFIKAVEIADTIDWTRVRSVSVLCTISDLYKINRRYKEAKEVLLQAYERHPGGRTILYSLCELCIKTDDVIGAIEYYKEFVQLAPTDNGKFILQYKIYEAQDVSLEERIAVLEELKKREFLEKWGYELAYLYHRIGLGTKCVEECDQLILWFREGRYIKKAMELKMLHQPLTAEQEASYKRMLPAKEQEQYDQQTKVYEEAEEIQVKTVDISQYNTLNLQKELAESMKEVLVADNGFSPLYSEEEALQPQVAKTIEQEESATPEEPAEPEFVRPLPSQMPTAVINDIFDKLLENSPEEVEAEFPQLVPEADTEQAPEVGMVELSAPVDNSVENLKEVSAQEIGEDDEEYPDEEDPLEGTEETEGFFLGTDEIPKIPLDYSAKEAVTERNVEPAISYVEEPEESTVSYVEEITEVVEEPEEPVQEEVTLEPVLEEGDVSEEVVEESPQQEALVEAKPTQEETVPEDRPSIREVMQGKQEPDLTMVNPPDEMGRLLSQESDGQISLVVPESEAIEKQITGQLNLEDILAEWEKTKKENEEKRKREIQQRVLEQTGTMFTEFEAKIRDGILEKLENNMDVPGLDEFQTEEELFAEEEDVANEAGQEMTEITPEDILPLEEQRMEEDDSVEELEEIAEDDSSTGESKEEESFSFVSDSISEKEMVKEEGTAVKAEPVRSGEEDTVRNMTEEEISLFSPFVQTKGARVRLMQSLDKISLAAYTGNVFVTGETQEEAVELAKSVVRDVQMTDRNFSGKVAKVTGQSLNNREVEPMVEKLANGALIIERAAGMDAQTVKDLLRALNQEKTGIVVVLQDTKKAMHKMMEYFSGMKEAFNIHIEVEELGDDALVAYGKKYARHLEYAIDEMGVLALHTRIAQMQTSDHIVSVADVREIVDEAIEHAKRKNLRHFTDVLFAKRYDDDDMIILRERDFLD